MKAEAAKAAETIRALEIRRQEIEASIAGPSPEQQLEAAGAGGSGARSDSAHGAATAVAVEPLLEPLLGNARPQLPRQRSVVEPTAHGAGGYGAAPYEPPSWVEEKRSPGGFWT